MKENKIFGNVYSVWILSLMCNTNDRIAILVKVTPLCAQRITRYVNTNWNGRVELENIPN